MFVSIANFAIYYLADDITYYHLSFPNIQIGWHDEKLNDYHCNHNFIVI